ncbi:MAG: hypothetical protein ORO03_08730, partial [Alphaproteobacteria bacterium]|nr:hypothetical protein [Alphaproteobacteria bacterium]
VSTLAPHGRTGTLLLDPATIEIGVGSTPGVSYISAATLATALDTNNVTIDANAATTQGMTPAPLLGSSGSGLITLSDDVLATSGTSSLSLVGAQIILKANLTVKGNLSLIATRGSVWQDATKVITAPSVSGKGNDGFILNGANRFDQIGAINVIDSLSNSGSGGVLIRNDLPLTLMNYSSFDGGKGGVTVITSGKDVTVEAEGITVTGAYLRFDLGSLGHLLGAVKPPNPNPGLVFGQSPHIDATGLAVYVTSALTGNTAWLKLENGSLTFVNDLRSSVTGATVIDNATSSTTATIGWGSGISFTAGTADDIGTPFNGGGMKVYSRGGISSVNNQGVVYGGTVEIRGVTTGAAKDLRYIEGTGVAVTIPTTPAGLTAATGGSSFSGGLFLVGNGAGITSGGDTAGVLIKANLSTSNGGDLSLYQRGSSTGAAIAMSGASVKASGNLSVFQSGSAALDGITVTQAPLTAGGALSLTQAGNSGSGSGITITAATITAARVLSLIQSGLATQNGIKVDSSSLSAGASLSLLQNGTIASGGSGIFLNASGAQATQAVSLAAGFGNIVTLKTNVQKLSLNGTDSFAITHGKLRIDLGVGVMTSSAGSFSFKALDADVYFTGASSGHSATIAVDRGSFTRVIDNHAITGRTVITSGSSFVIPSTGGLVVTGSISTRLNRIGVVYGGKVEVQSITPGSDAANLGYIEGSGIGFTTGTSIFGGSLTVVSNGSGYISTPAEAQATGYDTSGILLNASVTVGSHNDGLSDLSLVELGSGHSMGIHAPSGLTLQAGGDIMMVQTGVAENIGIALFGTSALPLFLKAGGDIYLNQAGKGRHKGIEVADATLATRGTVTVIQSGTVVQESAITLLNTAVKADGAITVSQLGSSSNGIRAEASSFTAGGDLTLQQLGSLTGNPATSGIVLYATAPTNSVTPPITHYKGVTLTAGRQNSVTLRTMSQSLQLTNGGDFRVSGARLRIDLGSGVMRSISDTPTTPPSPLVLNAAGMAVYYTGAKTGNLGAIAVGNGSFSFVNDLRAVTATVTLDRDTIATTATSGWGSGISFTAGTAAAGVTPYSGGGLTVSTSGADTTVKNQGVVYGGNVILNGVGTSTGSGSGTATNLSYIEGTGIAVTTLASGFSGGLVLMSSGAGFVTTGDNGTATLGITVEVALTAGTTNDGRSDLILQQRGNIQGYGIGISANLGAGRDIAVFSDGNSLTRALHIQTSALRAGRDITLVSNGRFGIGNSSYGISLLSSSFFAGGMVSLLQTAALGSDALGIALISSSSSVSVTAGQGVALRIANNNLLLVSSGGADAASFTSPRVRLDLGSGALVSLASGGNLLPAAGYRLAAFGSNLYFTGATSGNRATIEVSSGSFTFVNDRRTTVGSKTLTDSSTAANDWGSGLGVLTSAAASASGLTVIGININNQGVVYDGTVEIQEIGIGAARNLRYIEGGSITLNGFFNSFSGSLSLVTGQYGTVSLDASLATVGRFDIVGGGLTLNRGVTTAGGDVTIYLGNRGVYNNGSSQSGGYTLSTSGMNLSFTAGSISNPAASAAIFRLGNGNLTLGGGVALANRTRNESGASWSNSNYITSQADEEKFTASDVVYYFTSDTGSALTANKSAAGVGSKAFWLDASALSQDNLGSKTVTGYTDHFTSSGLSERASGDYFWAMSGFEFQNSVGLTTVFALKSQRAVHFYNLVNPTISAANRAWLARSASLQFDGASNRFNGGLTISSTGAITQASGNNGNSNSLIISGGSLTVTGSSEITLTGNINQIAGFGALSSTGAITITNSQAASLNGNLTTTGSGATISLDNTNYSLTLGGNIVTSGGSVTINLRNGSFVAGSYSLTTSNQNLSLRAGSVSATNNDQTVLALGTGTLTLTGSALATVSSGGDIHYYDYDPATLSTRILSTELASDPNAAGAQWIFYGAAGVVVPGLVSMNSTTLLAGKFIKKVTGSSVTKAGLDSATTGTIQFKAAFTSTDDYREIGLAAGHAMSLSNLGSPGSRFTLGSSLPVAASITFMGANHFTGAVTLNSTGPITQDGGATLSIEGGSFNVTNSTAITLMNSGTDLGTIGNLRATNSITITNDRSLILSGAIETTGSPGGIALTTNVGGISLSGAVSLNGGLLTLTAAAGISQLGNSTLTVSRGSLSLSAGSSAGILLTNLGNRIATIRALSSGGSIALVNDVSLTLNGILRSTGASSTIDITSAGVTLGSNVTSSGGAVTLRLGSGVYSNGVTGFSWTTTGQYLRLETTATPTIAGVGFKVGAGHFTHTVKASTGFGDAQTIFVSNSHGADGKQRISPSDPTDRFFSLSEIAEGIASTSFSSSSPTSGTEPNGDSYLTADISFTLGERKFPVATATIVFWNIRDGSLETSHSYSNAIRFDGALNSFNKFIIGTGADTRLIVGKNSILNGAITVAAGGIDFEAGATARRGSLTAAAGQDLKLNFQSDFV